MALWEQASFISGPLRSHLCCRSASHAGGALGVPRPGSKSYVWKFALPPGGIHPKIVNQVHEFEITQHPPT